MGKERAQRRHDSFLAGLPRLYDSAADYEEDCAEPTRDGDLDRSAVEAMLRRADAKEQRLWPEAKRVSSGVQAIDAMRIADAIAEMAEPLDSEHAARGRERSVVLSADELVEDEPPPVSGVRDTLLDEVEVECLFDAPVPSVVPEDDLERTLVVTIQQRLIGIPFPADPGQLQPIVPLTRCRIPKVRVPPPPLAIPPAPDAVAIPPETSSPPRLLLTLLGLAFASALVAGYLNGWIAP